MFKRLMDSVAQAADQVKESVSDAFDATKDTVTAASERVVDVVSDAYDTTRTTVAETSERAVMLASDAYDATRDTVSSAAETVVDTLSETYQTAKSAATSGFDSSRDYMANFGQSMSEFWEARRTREDSKIKEAESRGEAKAKMLFLEREKSFEAALEKATARIQDNDSYFRMLIAMQAVAQACAACDDEVTKDEQEQIDELLLGMGAKWLPPNVRSALDALIAQPPSLKEAFSIAQAVGDEAQDLFQEIVRFVIYLDGEVSSKEQQFLAHWVHLRASA